jgi:hypothetical protein
MLLADVDWTVVISAVGGAVVLVVGALGGWYLKILAARADIASRQREADERAKKDGQANDRKARKDTLEELYEILAVQRKDREDDRQLIHGLRNDMVAANHKLAICEHDREQLQWQADENRAEIDELRTALVEAGIRVPHRGGGWPAKPRPESPAAEPPTAEGGQ